MPDIPVGSRPIGWRCQLSGKARVMLMRNRTFCFNNRVALLIAVSLPVLATLGGCAGGGGSGPAGIPPPFGSGYPTLANATSANTGPGNSVAYTIAPGSNKIDGVA